MKRVFLSTIIISTFTLPAFAVCSITGGACSFETSQSYIEFNPNRLDTTNRNNIDAPDSILENVQKNFNKARKPIPQTDDYDANCQFGICLPDKGK